MAETTFTSVGEELLINVNGTETPIVDITLENAGVTAEILRKNGTLQPVLIEEVISPAAKTINVVRGRKTTLIVRCKDHSADVKCFIG